MTFYENIARERKRQFVLFGQQHHLPSWWIVILGEELGEAFDDFLIHEDNQNELIQVAAVATAWIEDITGQNTDNVIQSLRENRTNYLPLYSDPCKTQHRRMALVAVAFGEVCRSVYDKQDLLAQLRGLIKRVRECAESY